jgi:hypothetical protein
VDIRQEFDTDLAESRMTAASTETHKLIVTADSIQGDCEEMVLADGVVVDCFSERDTSVRIDNFVDEDSFESEYIPSGSHNLSPNPPPHGKRVLYLVFTRQYCMLCTVW